MSCLFYELWYWIMWVSKLSSKWVVFVVDGYLVNCCLFIVNMPIWAHGFVIRVLQLEKTSARREKGRNFRQLWYHEFENRKYFHTKIIKNKVLIYFFCMYSCIYHIWKFTIILQEYSEITVFSSISFIAVWTFCGECLKLIHFFQNTSKHPF